MPFRSPHAFMCIASLLWSSVNGRALSASNGQHYLFLGDVKKLWQIKALPYHVNAARRKRPSVLYSAVPVTNTRTSPKWNYSKQGEDWIFHHHFQNTKRQSPIHFLEETADAQYDVTRKLTLHYNDTLNDYNLYRTSNAFKIEPRTEGDFGYATLLDGTRFNIVEGHFHSPAEHTFGKNPEWRRGLEYHLVHKNEEGNNILVVGVTFVAKPNGSNALLSRLLNLDALVEGARKTRTVPLDHRSLFPVTESSSEAYYYPGSLTTPPCTQNVDWYIIREPLPASQEQIDSFDSYLREDNSLGNYRIQQNIGKNQNNFQKVVRTSVLVTHDH